MKSTLFFGYTGLIGNKLLKNLHNIPYFQDHQQILCFSRKKINTQLPNFIHFIQYSPKTLQDQLKETLSQKKQKWTIILLTGEPIFNLITPKQWEKIYNSRVQLNQKIIKTIEETQTEVEKIICASAIGIYYQSKQSEVTENSEITQHYFTNFIKEWEDTTLKSSFSDKAIILRFGAVLDKNSKIYESLKIPSILSLGINFTPDSPFPWIHNNEIPLILDFLLQKNQSGIFNIVNTNYLTFGEFLEKFIKNNSPLKKAFILNLPKQILKKFLSLLMPSYYEVIYSLFDIPKVIPQKLIDLKYEFKFLEIP
ncbi:MAG: hypothetical protein ACK4GJ_00225 [bacterium]